MHLTEPPDPADHHSMFAVMAGKELCQAIDHAAQVGVELPQDIDIVELRELCEQAFDSLPPH